MSEEGRYESWQFKAGQDLSNIVPGTGVIHKAVRNITGGIAANGQQACGLLKYGCNSGQHATMGVYGNMKYTAAAAITSADTLLTVTTSGYCKAAGSGDWIIGKCTAAVGSGMVGNGFFNFLTPAYYNPTENSSGS